jgi:transcriptional regulator with XRE-family HTH domain
MSTEIDPQRLAEFLRDQRGERGLRDMAAEMQHRIGIATYSRLENGKPATPEQIAIICQHFNMAPDELNNFPLLVRYPEPCPHEHIRAIDFKTVREETVIRRPGADDWIYEDRSWELELPISACLDCGKVGRADGWADFLELDAEESAPYKEHARKMYEDYQASRK